MAPLRTPLVLAAVLALGTGGCQRTPPPQPPADPNAAGLVLRYEAAAAPLRQQLELQLTHTRLGLYVEAGLEVRAELRLGDEGEALRTGWTLVDVPRLELDGAIEPDDVDQVRALLTLHGQGVIVGDRYGLTDTAATNADPTNAARKAALAGPADAAPPTGPVLLDVLGDQLRLPRLPPRPLERGTPVEVVEESETVLVDFDLVLPTTTVHRFTLRRVEVIDGVRVADVEVVIASVAQLDADPNADDDDATPVEADAELRTQSEGTLMFDVDHGLPQSLELTHTETLRVGDQELEQSYQVRSTFSIAPTASPASAR